MLTYGSEKGINIFESLVLRLSYFLGLGNGCSSGNSVSDGRFEVHLHSGGQFALVKRLGGKFSFSFEFTLQDKGIHQLYLKPTTWKWIKKSVPSPVELRDPLASSGYQWCLKRAIIGVSAISHDHNWWSELWTTLPCQKKTVSVTNLAPETFGTLCLADVAFPALFGGAQLLLQPAFGRPRSCLQCPFDVGRWWCEVRVRIALGPCGPRLPSGGSSVREPRTTVRISVQRRQWSLDQPVALRVQKLRWRWSEVEY